MHPRAKAILDRWFEGVPLDGPLDQQSPTVKRWFSRDDAFDAELRRDFGDDLDRAVRGDYALFRETAEESLALVLFCDQVSRNVHRNTPRAFASDGLALSTTMSAIDRGLDVKLPILQRGFLLMPYMHSEVLAVHDLAKAQYQRLIADAEAKNSPGLSYCRYTWDYELKHRAIIERFGRYPHRNAVLGRASTDEEVAFLKEPGSSF